MPAQRRIRAQKLSTIIMTSSSPASSHAVVTFLGVASILVPDHNAKLNCDKFLVQKQYFYLQNNQEINISQL